MWPNLEDRLTAVQIEGKLNWMLKQQSDWLDQLDDQKPVLRLLPFFDTYLLGYANREQLIAKAHVAKIIKGGVIDSMVALDGWIIGTWRVTPRKGSLALSVQYFEDQPVTLQPLVEAEAEQLGQFLNKKVTLLDSSAVKERRSVVRPRVTRFFPVIIRHLHWMLPRCCFAATPITFHPFSRCWPAFANR